MGELENFVGRFDGFEWDTGNSDKNWLRHDVRQAEAEQALLNTPLVVETDFKHSGTEPRFIALGQTDLRRLLAVVFTTKGTRIRVISACAMSKAERKVYGQAQSDSEADS